MTFILDVKQREANIFLAMEKNKKKAT